MRPNRLGLLSLVGLALVLSCRDATQIRVRVETTLNCPGDGPNELREASILAGGVGRVEGPAQAVAATCERKGSPNYVGDLIVFPKGDKDASAEVWVIAALDNGNTDPPMDGELPGTTSEACLEAYVTAPDRFPDTCIISKRRLGFVPHEELKLTIALDVNCAGKACEPDTTCYRNGQCGDSEVECVGTACALPGEGQGQGGAGATNSTGTGNDASSGSGDVTSTADGTSTTGTLSSNASTSSSSSGGGEGGGGVCPGVGALACMSLAMCEAACGPGRDGCCDGNTCFCDCDPPECDAFCVSQHPTLSGVCQMDETCTCVNGGVGGGGGGCTGTPNGNPLCPDETMCDLSCGVGRTGCCEANTCFCDCDVVACNVECVGMGANSGSCIGDTCLCETGMGGAGGGAFLTAPPGSGARPVPAAATAAPFFTRRFDPDPPTLASHVAATILAARERLTETPDAAR